MLKITLTLRSNVHIKNSNARISQSLRRLYWLYSIFFKLNSCCKIDGLQMHSFLKFKLKSGCMVLMRSPFHYKVSKTLLSIPKQTLDLVIFVPYDATIPLFFNKKLYNFLFNLNKTDALQILNIRVVHVMLNFKRSHKQLKNVSSGYIHCVLLQLKAECSCCLTKPHSLQYNIKNKLYKNN